ncbi:hypothetical protein [Pseudobacteroides cellulosolvens]|uniref:Uncharacterized protein n=1 Tax=Pseudobacteroides cellulosolvens ATCC 35603 = DSM 2933 TaxID=398512 RepID=A0A0L6JVZ7_9FIRM|nr:hypothetical protein [Pseudobacteroides cellulosolvens]KNY30041.1 hypothetical protein Bccel_5318 [Pseudobacteroides cellulosolvens ATCC 35603 = DSM 2933]
MTNRLRLVKIILLSTMFFSSFFLLIGTSWFDYLIKMSGSYMYAVIFINAAVVSVVFLTIFAGARLEKIIYIVSLVFCFPSVLYNSKLNWFEIIWGLKVSDRNPFILTALIIIYIVLGIFLVERLIKYDNRYDDWIASGALESDAIEAYKNRMDVLIFTVGFTAVPLFAISIFGSLTNLPRFKAMGSVVLAILGALAAAFAVFYFAGISTEEKD